MKRVVSALTVICLLFAPVASASPVTDIRALCRETEYRLDHPYTCGQYYGGVGRGGSGGNCSGVICSIGGILKNIPIVGGLF